MSKNSTKPTFDTVLDKIRKKSKNTVEVGTKFEKIMFDFLRTDSIYTKRFKKVQMWNDWARDNNIKEKVGTRHDLGIDIVAQEIDDTLCAIQCKCYDEDTEIQKGDVDSFIAAGRTYEMENYMLACTSAINKNALAMLKGARCNIITKEHLRNSSIDWSGYPKIKPKQPKKLRDYQQSAMNDVIKGFYSHDRGKMIMACGTGKTLVSLRIAEKLAGKGGTILYLVPSISLILQSMREWSDNAKIQHYYMAVCSDRSIRNSEDGLLIELEAPASTDREELSVKLSERSTSKMNVIFSTYNSIHVVVDAMKNKTFDLILCDEAHRTAAIENKKKESFLTIVHKNNNVKSKRRLYMTATPRIYTDDVKNKAEQKEKKVISMDEVSIYGPTFHELTFYDAVHKYNALSDFKVRVAIMDDNAMDKLIQQSMARDDNTVPLSEKTLMASAWHALEYPGIGDRKEMLQRVIMFCDMINSSKLLAGEKLDYKADVREDPEMLASISEIDRNRSFGKIVEHIKKVKGDNDQTKPDIRHVDGSDNAQSRRRELDWLRDSQDDPNTCRILSNARCLSEGVDVPALDGVVFMNPRKSVVDVVQAVGRVMRKSPGKKYGYVVLPVAIPAGISVEDALSDSKHFKVVWQVLNALRSHDKKLAEEINRLTLEPPRPGDNQITNRIIIRHAGSHNLYSPDMPVDRLITGITTKLVEKVGDADYYDKYGARIGETTKTVETRIKNKINTSPKLKSHLDYFQEGLKQIINENVTRDESIQAISQHIVMSKVFDMMFSGMFTSYNPISKILDKISDKLDLKEELKTLEPFYVETKAEILKLETRIMRQNFIKKLYSNFFASASKDKTEQHGIVYSPVEIVDYIINSVQILLKKHFRTEFNDRNVKVLEPFAGTGTFVSRLLESEHITSNIYEKYKHDIFANELMLLAYYVSSVNIETTYSSLRSGKYVPFNGMSYTDTLEQDPQYRKDKLRRKEQISIHRDFIDIHNHTRRQSGTHIHVLIGNPPYSVGQDNYNKGVKNKQYPLIDKRIKDTYVERLKKINPTITQIRSIYDSYIRSIRWAVDRIGNSGIIAFITNASFIRSDVTAGLRACLEDEFDEIWCYDLRGNRRTKGEESRKEGGEIFGQGSRTPIAILILVKKPPKKQKEKCAIFYNNVGDYLTKSKKLQKITNEKSIIGTNSWQDIKSDKHKDWLEHRTNNFLKYIVMGSKDVKQRKSTYAIFQTYSSGVKTNRDAWMYNSSKINLESNMKQHMEYCNNQDLVNPIFDKKRAKWTQGLSMKLKKNKPTIDKNLIRIAMYRPFFKQWLYFEPVYIESMSRNLSFYPYQDTKNLTICIPYKFTGEFSTFMINIISDLAVISNGQCFPFYIYEKNGIQKQNIANSTLEEYHNHYNDKTITKEAIFYYVYAMLHHKEYKSKFANNLMRELPRIPMALDFWKFKNAGKKLSDIHLNYEKCQRYSLGKPKSKFGNLEKLSYVKVRKDGRSINDKAKLKINGIEIYDNIPFVNYQVNGRTPLEWLIDKYRAKKDPDSGIIKNPNEGMTEQKTIEMIERILYVGTESDKIIDELSKLPFEPENWEPKKIGMDKYT